MFEKQTELSWDLIIIQNKDYEEISTWNQHHL